MASCVEPRVAVARLCLRISSCLPWSERFLCARAVPLSFLPKAKKLIGLLPLPLTTQFLSVHMQDHVSSE